MIPIMNFSVPSHRNSIIYGFIMLCEYFSALNLDIIVRSVCGFVLI